MFTLWWCCGSSIAGESHIRPVSADVGSLFLSRLSAGLTWRFSGTELAFRSLLVWPRTRCVLRPKAMAWVRAKLTIPRAWRPPGRTAVSCDRRGRISLSIGGRKVNSANRLLKGASRLLPSYYELRWRLLSILGPFLCAQGILDEKAAGW